MTIGGPRPPTSVSRTSSANQLPDNQNGWAAASIPILFGRDNHRGHDHRGANGLTAARFAIAALFGFGALFAAGGFIVAVAGLTLPVASTVPTSTSDAVPKSIAPTATGAAALAEAVADSPKGWARHSRV
jgi:hypothetical protein